MTRFFFDVVHSTSSAYDFHGRYFKTVAQAREMAEIVCRLNRSTQHRL